MTLGEIPRGGDAKSSDRWRDSRRWKSLVGDQGVDLWCDAEIYVILDRRRDNSIYRSHRLSRSVT
jgi:hypothetical protein